MIHQEAAAKFHGARVNLRHVTGRLMARRPMVAWRS
jgi:hypothetical protein